MKNSPVNIDVPKTAIIGASGYIGKHLLKRYRKVFPDTLGTSCSRKKEGLSPFDFRNPDIESLCLRQNGYTSVIIASGTPGVAWCEANKEESYEINVRGPLRLAKELEKLGISTIYLSSDYVFDGDDGGYDDDASTSARTEYGRQKAEFEREISTVNPQHLVVRLSKVYGLEHQDGTLLDSLAKDLSSGNPVTVANDQFFCPTFVEDIVSIIQTLQIHETHGLVNLASPEIWSRQNLALALCSELGISNERIQVSPLHQIRGMEERPKNTSLRCVRLLEEVRPDFLPLKTGIQKVAQNWLNAHSAGKRRLP